MHEEDFILILDAEKKKIQEDFKRQGQMDPFSGFNASGSLINPESFEKTAKQVDSTRRLNSPATALSTLGIRTPTVAPVSFQALYDLNKGLNLGEIAKQFMLDGAVLAMPGLVGNSGQFRAAGPSMKGTWYEHNYKELLQAAIPSEVFNNPDILWANYNNRKPELWLPTNAATEVAGGKEQVERFWRNNFTDEERKAGQPNQIRDRFFVNVLDQMYDAIMPDSVLKNEGKFSLVPANVFENYNHGIDFARAKAEGRIDSNGMVQLNTDEAVRYMHDTMQATGGLYYMRTAKDFLTDDSEVSIPGLGKVYRMPRMFAENVLTEKDIEESAKLYSDAFAALRDPQIAFAGNPEALEKIRLNGGELPDDLRAEIVSQTNNLRQMQQEQMFLVSDPFKDALALPTPGSIRHHSLSLSASIMSKRTFSSSVQRTGFVR